MYNIIYVINFLKFTQDWGPFIFACKSTFQMLKTIYKHHNNRNFFPIGKNSLKLISHANFG
jgi:hypothetical protein